MTFICMKLSSDTLFHFSNIGAVTNILSTKRFWPIYNLEIFTSEYYSDHRYGIPMVCFCDLVFSLTECHRQEYGTSAIGLKKSWAIANGLNPISYQLEKSVFTSASESLTQLLQALTDESAKDQLPEDILNNQIKSPYIRHLLHKFLITIHGFKKQYQRENINNVITYYDEREWRYIPAMIPDTPEEYENLKRSNAAYNPAIDETTFNNKSLKEQYQNYVNVNHSLNFTENDIDIIAVSSEKEKVEIHDKLKDFYSAIFLKSKIKTYAEICD